LFFFQWSWCLETTELILSWCLSSGASLLRIIVTWLQSLGMLLVVVWAIHLFLHYNNQHHFLLLRLVV
jgi:hypothetical protein